MGERLVVFVTGATRGIGRRSALALASRHRVIAAGRERAPLDALRAESGGVIETVILDVVDRRSIDAAAVEIDRLTDGAGVDVLINNAGFGKVAPIIETTDSELRALFETNVFGLMAITRALVPAMIARRAGRIINVSSIGGRVTFPFFGAYNATKHAVESLSDALRLELAPFNVHVSLVEPGPIRTEFYSGLDDDLKAHAGEQSAYERIFARPDAIKSIIEKNAGTPEAVARVIVDAVCARKPRARYVVPLRWRILLPVVTALPIRLRDWIMGISVGLTRARLAAVRSPKG